MSAQYPLILVLALGSLGQAWPLNNINSRHTSMIILCILLFSFDASFMFFHWNDAGNWDNQGYAFVASRIFNGAILYKDVWLDKPPLAFILYAPALIFENAGLGMSLWFCGVVDIQAILLYALLTKCGFTSRASLTSVVAMLVIIVRFSDLNWLSLSHLGNLLVLAAATIAASKTKLAWLASGGLIAAGFFVRQNSILLAAVPLIIWHPNYRNFIAFVIGGIASTAVITIGFAQYSDLGLMIDATFFYPQRYLQLERVGERIPSSMLIARIFLSYASVPLAIFSLGSLVATWKSPRSWRPVSQFVVIFGVLFVTCLLPHKPFLHYAGYMLPWLSAAIGWTSHQIAELLRTRLSSTWAVAALAALITVAVYRSLLVPIQSFEAYSDIRSAISTVERSSAGVPTVQVFCHVRCGPNGLLLRNHTPAIPLFHMIYFTPDFSPALPEALHSPWDLLSAAHPTIIVYDRNEMSNFFGYDLRSRIDTFLESHDYRSAAHIKGVDILVANSKGKAPDSHPEPR